MSDAAAIGTLKDLIEQTSKLIYWLPLKLVRHTASIQGSVLMVRFGAVLGSSSRALLIRSRMNSAVSPLLSVACHEGIDFAVMLLKFNYWLKSYASLYSNNACS